MSLNLDTEDWKFYSLLGKSQVKILAQKQIILDEAPHGFPSPSRKTHDSTLVYLPHSIIQ